MHRRPPLHGIIPPLVLPMAGDGSFDFESLRRLVAFLLDRGVHGLWINGTTGDFHALEHEERLAVLREVVKAAAGRVPVTAQVGDAATRRALRHLQAAVEAGADYVSAIAPYYLDYSQGELRSYYRDLAAASPVPLVLYHLPKMSKVGLTVESVLELVRDGTAVAIKDSAGDMTWYRQLISACRTEGLDLRCFVGGGALIDSSLLGGGNGAMCAIANLLPSQCVAIYQAAMAQDWARAAALQYQLQDVIGRLTLPSRSNWAASIAVYKWVLAELGIIASDAVAAPLESLSEDEQLYLRERALPAIRRLEPGYPDGGAGRP